MKMPELAIRHRRPANLTYPTWKVAAHALAGIAAVCIGVLTIPVAFFLPGAEPFATWSSYLLGALLGPIVYGGMIAAIAAVPVLLIIWLGDDDSRAAAMCTSRLWLVMPLLLLWCLAFLVAATYNPSFGLMEDTKLPPSTEQWVRPAANPLWLFLVAGLAIWLCRRGYRTSFDQLRRHDHGLCASCGYDVRTVPGPNCPECAAPLAMQQVELMR